MDEFYFQITEEYEGERIDRCMAMLMDSLSRSYIQKLIREGQVLVNGGPVKNSYPVQTDDEVRFSLPPPRSRRSARRIFRWTSFMRTETCW